MPGAHHTSSLHRRCPRRAADDLTLLHVRDGAAALTIFPSGRSLGRTRDDSTEADPRIEPACRSRQFCRGGAAIDPNHPPLQRGPTIRR